MSTSSITMYTIACCESPAVNIYSAGCDHHVMVYFTAVVNGFACVRLTSTCLGSCGSRYISLRVSWHAAAVLAKSYGGSEAWSKISGCWRHHLPTCPATRVCLCTMLVSVTIIASPGAMVTLFHAAGLYWGCQDHHLLSTLPCNEDCVC